MSEIATASVPDDLPRSRKALHAIAEGLSWDTTVQDIRRRSELRAWVVAAAATILAVLGFGFAVLQATRPMPAPVPIVVDRTTGETMVVGRFDEQSIPRLSALDQHNAAVFVRAYESYFFNLLKRDYEQVARMATQEVFAPYSARFSGDSALQTKLGTAWEHRVTVISVRMSTTTAPGRNGEAIVSFDKEVRSNQGMAPVTTRYVATVRFEYRPASIKKDVDRIENPFGFVVLSYRADPELLAPVPATTTDASRSS